MKDPVFDNRSHKKEEAWKEAVFSLYDEVNGSGLEIDQGVRELVIALNLNGIPTSSSCEGHAEGNNIRPPYIQGKAEGMPEFRYRGEKEVVERIISKYGFTEKTEIYGNDESKQEYYESTDNLEESDDYKEWYQKNEPLEKEVSLLLEEFNNEYKDNKLKLHLSPSYPGYRVEVNLGIEYKNKVFTGEDREKFKSLIIEAQGVFSDFKDFLKARYFNK